MSNSKTGKKPNPEKIYNSMKTAVNLLEEYDKELTACKPYKYKFEKLKELTEKTITDKNTKIKELESYAKQMETRVNKEELDINEFDNSLQRFTKCYSKAITDKEREDIDKELSSYIINL